MSSAAIPSSKAGKPVVFFMINSLAGGGAERIMVRLLTHSKAYLERFDIHLVLLDREPVAYAPPAWLKVHQLDTRFSLLRGLQQVYSLFRKHRPDVCLSFLSRANFINIALCRLIGHSAVISERVNTTSHHSTSRTGQISVALTRLLYPRARKVIAVSAGIAHDLATNHRVAPHRLVVIPNPVDAEEIRSQAGRPVTRLAPGPYIVGMGRLVENKNFDLLLSAFARSNYSGHLLLLGEGQLRPALEARAREYGIAYRTIMPGFIDQPFAHVAGADAYILPSNGEGFPNGLIEAMTLGLPVISTNCQSGPSEILDDKPSAEIIGLYEAKYGLLVPTNKVEPMAEAIDYATSPQNRHHLSDRAKTGAARYDLQRTVGAYWAEIEQIIR